MRGTDATTGKALSGLDHLKQSIRDILTTPIGSRVMRRDYGSRLFELVDAPLNRRTILELYAATVEALNAWEKRLLVQQVQADESSEAGRISLTITGLDTSSGQVIVVGGIVL
jgi:phage baseplate assembly protein W